MGNHAFVLADRDRPEQFAFLGETRGLFRARGARKVWKDPAGIAWVVRRAGRHAIAATWFGPGWVFDSYARKQRADNYAARRKAMQRATPTEHGEELANVLRQLRLGGQCERLLWAVHQCVLESRSSVVRVPHYRAYA